MFDLITFCRFFVAGVIGGLMAYVICLLLFAKMAGVELRWSTAFDAEIRRGGEGFARLYLAWVVAFTTYGLIATYDATPFTYAWLHCAILDGDWVVILVAPLLFAYSEWRYSSERPTRSTDHCG